MSISKLPKKASNTPGVYIFRRGKTAIYVGKAENLRKRLASYFRKNAGQKVESLRQEATRLEWSELSSDIEALIKESELIKKYRPKYNVLMRDDKNYFYVGFSQDEFPRIFVTHQTGIKYLVSGIKGRKARNTKYKIQNTNFIGPFTSGSALYSTLRILRRIFPYCTCKEFHKRPCLNAQIGRCPGFCCYSPPIVNPFKTRSYFKWQNEYRRNIRNITAVLCGKKKTLIHELRKEMREAAKKEEFEHAAELQKQIEGIENIFSHRTFLDPALAKQRRGHDWQKIERTIQALFGTMRRIRRVEGYDISNISGTAATGSMAVFVDGAPSKNNYRKFKIKTVTGISDVDMHREVLNRRFRHSDGWGTPDLLLIDGGKPQVSAALQALQMRKVKGILLAGLAKREEELFLPGRRDPIRLDFLPAHTSHFFQHVRDESHRFAKKYHHKLREISYRNESR